MVKIRIITCPQRADMAETLKTALGLADTDVFCDDREGGGNPYYIFKKAFADPVESGVTHILVLNDDVEVSDGFQDICEQMVQAHPECAFSLFSERMNSSYFDTFLADLQTPYLDHSGNLYGCAVILPVPLIQDCFNWIDANFDAESVHDSQGVRDFLTSRQVPTLTTYPMLVQHIGDTSVYNPGLPIRRTTRFEKSPNGNWTAPEVAELPSLKWFEPVRSVSQGSSLRAEIFAFLKGDKSYGE